MTETCEHMDWQEGAEQRRQLRCARDDMFINPTGFTCELCRAGQWPAKIRPEDSSPGASAPCRNCTNGPYTPEELAAARARKAQEAAQSVD